MAMKLLTAAAIVSVFWVAGCAGDEWCGSGLCMTGPSYEDGAVTFALSESDTQVRSFMIRLYKSATDRSRGKAYFESGCSGISKAFTISHLDAGDEYVVEYLGYSDKACTASNLARKGVRGSVRVTSPGTGFAYYFIQVNVVGDFTAMPLPDSRLNPIEGGVACESDSDCRRVIPCEDLDECRFKINVECDAIEIEAGECPDGYKVMQYNVHPRAVCDDRICRLDTLFPLNTRGDRAFAAAAATDIGDVVSLGGFTKYVDGFYVVQGASDPASSPETLSFIGDEGVFGVLEHDRPLDSGMGMSTVAMLGDGRLVVAGGTRKALAATSVSVEGAPLLESLFCSTDCPVEMSSYLYVIDTATGAVDRTTLAAPVIPAAVVPVARDTTSVYIRGSASMRNFAGDISSGGTTVSWICQITDGNAASCSEVNPSSAVSRFMPAGVCIKRKNGLCSEFLTLGGTDIVNKFAEIYFADTNTVKVFPATGDVPELLSGASALLAGDEIWLVGGTSDSDKEQPSVPFHVTVDSALGVVILSKVALDASGLSALARRFHQATVLADDGRVLVSGGIDQTGAVTRSAVLLSTAGGEMKILDAGLKMAEPRMGHSATLVTGGLFDGAILVQGGISSAGGVFAKGAEVFLPAN